MFRLTYAPVLVLALCGIAQAQNPLARRSGSPEAQAPDPLAGEWRGQGLVVVFQARGEKRGKVSYDGQIRTGGASFPLECSRAEDGGLRGAFEAEGERYRFTGQLEDDALTLESDGEVYRLAPVGRSASPGAAKAGDGQSAAPAGFASFTHPRGFQFQHPAGWQVQSSEDGIVVLAEGVERDAQGQPLEMFVIGGEQAESVQRPDQPEVLAWFDAQIAQMFPQMKRGGETQALESLLGPGAALAYSGATPTGLDGQADVYVTLHRGNGIFLLHLGRRDLVEAHRDQARRMFSSFGWTQGQLDPNLVGLWHREETSSSSSIGIDGGMDMVGSTANLYWEFRADGTVGYSSGARVFGDVGDISLHDSGGSPNRWEGTWSVSGDTVTVMWNEGGLEQARYNVFAHVDNQTALKLTAPGEEKGTFFIRQ